MIRTTFAALALVAAGGAASAASQTEIDALTDALDTAALMDVLRAEGLSQAGDIAAGLSLSPTVRGTWNQLVDTLYDTDRMEQQFTANFGAALRDVDVTEILAFFESDLGQRIVDLEISAREAFLEDGVEDAAEGMIATMRAEDDPRIGQLELFIESNDLIEANVAGGLNSSLAFFEGLTDAGLAMSEEEVLQAVWEQEPQIRTDTEGWIFAYLGLAYEPLTDSELDRYIDLSKTPQGEALNAALFAAFDPLFESISRELGRATGAISAGEDI